MPALPAVRITATRQNAGKTAFATRLIAELESRGYEVVAIKHSHHLVPPDKPGSDTERMADAGASRVVFCGPDGTLERRREPSPALASLLDRLAGAGDFAVVEGFKDEPVGARLHINESEPARFALYGEDGRRRLEMPLGDPSAASRVADELVVMAGLSPARGVPLVSAV
jgi:molybdopterin-guanine dinucleotide biosynthesis protein MobB